MKPITETATRDRRGDQHQQAGGHKGTALQIPNALGHPAGCAEAASGPVNRLSSVREVT